MVCLKPKMINISIYVNNICSPNKPYSISKTKLTYEIKRQKTRNSMRIFFKFILATFLKIDNLNWSPSNVCYTLIIKAAKKQPINRNTPDLFNLIIFYFHILDFVKCRLVKRIAPHDYHTCTVVCTMLKSVYTSIKCYGWAFFL